MEVNYFTILYWFCHTLTWIHHGYTCVPHPEPLLSPPSPSHPSESSQCTSPEHPVSCIEPGLVIRFTYNIHVSMPFSQTIPLSPSPTESKGLFYTSVSLLLSCIQGYRRDRSFKIPSRTTALGDGDDDGNDDWWWWKQWNPTPRVKRIEYGDYVN